MNIEEIRNLSRGKKEELYIELLRKLEEIRGEGSDINFDRKNFAKGLKIKQIEEGIIDFQKEIDNQRLFSILKYFFVVIKYLLYVLVLLGVVDLLLFGIKQLFGI